MSSDLENIGRNIQGLVERVRRAAQTGVLAHANNVMTEAKDRAPVDTGTLRASGYVGEPVVDGDSVTVEAGFGGPAGAYVVVQHERTELHHDVGEAKFLERAVDNQRNNAAQVIGAAITQALSEG